MKRYNENDGESQRITNLTVEKKKKGKSASTPSAYVSFMNGRSNSTSCTPSDVLGSSLTT